MIHILSFATTLVQNFLSAISYPQLLLSSAQLLAKSDKLVLQMALFVRQNSVIVPRANFADHSVQPIDSDP